jgi:pyridoxamine 5'-phosphate oxidase
VSGFPTPAPDDPLPLARDWLEAAARSSQRNPSAMALATAAPEHGPSVRMVLLKSLSVSRGYGVFYTHRNSRKGRELAANPRAAGVLYWEPLGRQLRLEGRIVRSPDAESDAYFASRPIGSQINAWVSAQSEPIAAFTDLDQRIEAKTREMKGTMSLPRPPHWGGYRLWFDAVEFWVEGRDRFHERVRYERALDMPNDDESELRAGNWNHRLLQP